MDPMSVGNILLNHVVHHGHFAADGAWKPCSVSHCWCGAWKPTLLWCSKTMSSGLLLMWCTCIMVIVNEVCENQPCSGAWKPCLVGHCWCGVHAPWCLWRTSHSTTHSPGLLRYSSHKLKGILKESLGVLNFLHHSTFVLEESWPGSWSLDDNSLRTPKDS